MERCSIWQDDAAPSRQGRRAMGFHMCTKGGEISCYWGLTRHLSSGTTSARREKVPTQVTRNPTEERGMRSVALAYYIIVRMNWGISELLALMLKGWKDLMTRYSIRPRPGLYTSVSPDLSRLAGIEVQVSFSWLKRCWCYYHGNKGAVAGGHRKSGVTKVTPIWVSRFQGP